MAGWKWWTAPKGTTSKRSNRHLEEEEEEDTEEDEDENNEEEEEEDEDEEAEPRKTCAFQCDWQEFDSDWGWRCSLKELGELSDSNDEVCRKEICPFWRRGDGIKRD